MNNSELSEYLKSHNIPFRFIYLKPGSLFYLPMNWYHRVESVNNTSHCILINVVPYHLNKSIAKHCDCRFNTLFPEGYKLCDTNNCLDYDDDTETA
jgi:hypothetical protein